MLVTLLPLGKLFEEFHVGCFIWKMNHFDPRSVFEKYTWCVHEATWLLPGSASPCSREIEGSLIPTLHSSLENEPFLMLSQDNELKAVSIQDTDIDYPRRGGGLT